MPNRRIFIIALFTLIAVSTLSVIARAKEAALLRVPKLALPLSGENVPLTLALQELGNRIRGGYVLFGVEVQKINGLEPTVKLSTDTGATLGDALRQITKQLPGYQFEVVSEHLINFYPTSARSDPANPLNKRVPRFDVNSQRAGLILSWPERFIPELSGPEAHASKNGSSSGLHIDLFVGAVAIGTVVTLHLRDVSVRQILNAVSEVTDAHPEVDTPLGWEYSYQPPSAPGQESVRAWRLLMTLPTDWHQQMEKERNIGHL